MYTIKEQSTKYRMLTTATAFITAISVMATGFCHTTDTKPVDKISNTQICQTGETFGPMYQEKQVVRHKKKEPKKSKTKKLNKKQVYLLSHAIYAEAGCEACHSDKTRYYVGSVILNRVKHPHFPNTIKGVIFQKGQYECTWNGAFYKKPSKKCIKIAKDLLRNGSVLPKNVIWQSQFKPGRGVYKHIDNMYFCY